MHNRYAIFAANSLLLLSRQEFCSSLTMTSGHVLRWMLIWVQPSPRSRWGRKEINNEHHFCTFCTELTNNECHADGPGYTPELIKENSCLFVQITNSIKPKEFGSVCHWRAFGRKSWVPASQGHPGHFYLLYNRSIFKELLLRNLLELQENYTYLKKSVLFSTAPCTHTHTLTTLPIWFVSPYLSPPL